MKGLGLDPVVVGCRFDCGMQVLRPELENHEKICDLKPPYTDEEHLHGKFNGGEVLQEMRNGAQSAHSQRDFEQISVNRWQI